MSDTSTTTRLLRADKAGMDPEKDTLFNSKFCNPDGRSEICPFTSTLDRETTVREARFCHEAGMVPVTPVWLKTTLVMEAGRSGRVPEIPFDWTFKDFKLDKSGRLAGNEPERPPPTKFNSKTFPSTSQVS